MMIHNDTHNDVQKDTLKIRGMTCASCVAHIQHDVESMEGVKEIFVNFATSKAEVSYDPDKVSLENIIQQIKKTGYSAEKKESEHATHHHEGHSDHAMGHEGQEETAHHDHSAVEDDKEIKSKKRKVIFGGIVSLMVLVLVAFVDIQNEGIMMIILTAAILIYTGGEFFMRGIPTLVLRGRPNMDTLVSLGVGAAFLYSSYNVIFTDLKEEYFIDAAIISTFIMLGRYLEAKAKRSATAAIKKLLELSAKVAHKIIEKNKTKDIPIDEVQVGDLLMVKPGEKIPVDGTIISGSATIDESMVTGESVPVDRESGQKIIGATVNGNTAFTMKAEKIGKETMLAQMIKLVEEAQMHKAPIQKLVNLISNYFVWAVMIIAIITFSGWYFVGGIEIQKAIIYTVAVLIIACPCALGLATPISIVVGSGKGASMGILIKKAESLEKMHKITSVCFDKTGTITEGKPKVTDFLVYKVPNEALQSFSLDGIAPDKKEEYEKTLVRYVGSLEHQSEHPLARAVVDFAVEKNEEFLETENVQAITGKGIAGKVNNREVLIGNAIFLESRNIMRCAELDEKAQTLNNQGKTVLFLAIDGKQRGILALQDEEKESSKEAIKLLHERNIKTVMMTGDNEAVAKNIAKNVGIDEIYAHVSPEDKVKIIKKLQEMGEFVAMVGDGINDAPALATANIGIAMGTGTDVAIESGDIVLVKGDLLKGVEAIELSRATFRNIKQNLFWAFMYNTIGIPIAAVGLLSPIFSAAAMAFSSISVVLNALRLKKFHIKVLPD